MKNKKKLIVWGIVILLTISIAGCGGKPELVMPSVALTAVAAGTEAGTATATATAVPTEAATATPTEIVRPSVDVTQSPDKWDLSTVPEAQRALVEKMITDSGAGKEAQDAFDALLIPSWQSTLEKAGVQDAEKLSGYALLDAIVEYANANGIHEVTLPFAIHKLILTDPTNLIPEGQRPGVPISTDAFYGQEINVSNMGLENLLETSVINFKSVNFFGEEVVRAENDPPFAMLRFGNATKGDLTLLVNIPGVNPSKEQAALLVLYDQNGNRHYFEINMNYDASLETNSRDLCMVARPTKNTVEKCQSGIKIAQTLMLVDQFTFAGNHPVTRQELVEFLSQEGSHHVLIESSEVGQTGVSMPQNIWQNGVEVGRRIAIIPTVFP